MKVATWYADRAFHYRRLVPSVSTVANSLNLPFLPRSHPSLDCLSTTRPLPLAFSPVFAPCYRALLLRKPVSAIREKTRIYFLREKYIDSLGDIFISRNIATGVMSRRPSGRNTLCAYRRQLSRKSYANLPKRSLTYRETINSASNIPRHILASLSPYTPSSSPFPFVLYIIVLYAFRCPPVRCARVDYTIFHIVSSRVYPRLSESRDPSL